MGFFIPFEIQQTFLLHWKSVCHLCIVGKINCHVLLTFTGYFVSLYFRVFLRLIWYVLLRGFLSNVASQNKCALQQAEKGKMTLKQVGKDVTFKPLWIIRSLNTWSCAIVCRWSRLSKRSVQKKLRLEEWRCHLIGASTVCWRRSERQWWTFKTLCWRRLLVCVAMVTHYERVKEPVLIRFIFFGPFRAGFYLDLKGYWPRSWPITG